jgi:hypothetical protein
MVDERVEGGAILLRKVHPAQVVSDNEGGWRPASGLFRGAEIRPGIRAFSVYVEARLAEAGAGADAILDPDEATIKSIVSFPVDLVRSMDLDAFYRPEGNEPSRRAHAEVEGQLTGSRCSRLSAAVAWVLLRPPGGSLS